MAGKILGKQVHHRGPRRKYSRSFWMTREQVDFLEETAKRENVSASQIMRGALSLAKAYPELLPECLERNVEPK